MALAMHTEYRRRSTTDSAGKEQKSEAGDGGGVVPAIPGRERRRSVRDSAGVAWTGALA